ncbi:TPA: hypothetical protein N0F65_002092 [Lagenidium giganteum]|uniref:Uncharacterized protein n=1 Tax=Lagenidium giganteum TaxID=4803 RepID=A0AAV2ZEE5_9STRA|nr:TPA: hypothetical protein N0F65_002092 [Lagenidium giganteum]
MSAWASLNTGQRDTAREPQARETEEAQEAKNGRAYEQALRHQQRGQVDEARAIYARLLQVLMGGWMDGWMDCGARLVVVLTDENDWNGVPQEPCGLSDHLRYLCNKNLATIELDKSEYDSAMRCFSQALELDDTDAVVWFEMAQTALETKKFWLARRLLEEGARVDATHWPLMELLCQVLHVLGDTDEYQRLEGYVGQHNPRSGSLYLINHLVEQQENYPDEVACLKALEADLASRWYKKELKQLQHLYELLKAAAAEREAIRMTYVDPVSSTTAFEYLLQKPSWQALGKLLLQAFDDVANEGKAHPGRTRIRLKAAFDASYKSDDVVEVVQPKKSDPGEDEGVIDLTDSVEDAEDEKPARKRKFSAASLHSGEEECIEILEEEAPRRKSRRHEEKLREEHEAARKEARDKDLAYRLGQLIELEFGGAEPVDCAFEWPAVATLQKGKAGFVFELDGTTTTMTPFSHEAIVSPGSPPDVEATVASSKHLQKAGTDGTNRKRVPSTKDLLEFIETEASDARSIESLQKAFLNQCGEWAHLQLASTGEDIHTVCFWVEKLVGGLMDPRASMSKSKDSKTVLPLVENWSQRCVGLTIKARLFLLELHVDAQIRKKSGKSKKKRTRTLLALVDSSQALLLDISMSDCMDETTQSANLARLFWVFGKLYEHLDNPSAAKSYFQRCIAHIEQSSAGQSPTPVHLPNLKADSEISCEVLQQKIHSLQFSDICFEARECFSQGDFDQAMELLLPHFFSSMLDTSPRMDDLMKDFPDTSDPEDSQNDSNEPIFSLLLAAARSGTSQSVEDRVLMEITVMYELIDVIRGLDCKSLKHENSRKNIPLGKALRALDLFINYFSEDVSLLVDDKSDALVSTQLIQLVIVCMIEVVNPQVLLLFHCPVAILDQAIDIMEKLSAAIPSIGNLLPRTIARVLYVIRMFEYDDFKALFAHLAPVSANRKKRSRRDRVRSVLTRVMQYLIERPAVISADTLISKPQRLELLRALTKMLKEEYESVTQHDNKAAPVLFACGSTLFLLLFASTTNSTNGSKNVVSLVRLIHERMGHEGICNLPIRGKRGSASSECFLDACVDALGRYVGVGAGTTKKYCADEDRGEGNESGDASEASDDDQDDDDDGSDIDRELAQCFRCLYDVQVLCGTEDHKIGHVTGLLTEKRTRKDADDRSKVLRLAQFCVPILLKKSPKSNTQKRENLKILYGIRDALLGPADHHAPSTPRSNDLRQFLAPKCLLQSYESPMDAISKHLGVVKAHPSTDEAKVLDQLWYLLGENFILARARRRGNLNELLEMEQKVKERAAFLVKDVTYCHPDRFASWTRLGKAFKELYHAATDASALLLGRNRKAVALQEYASCIAPADTEVDNLSSHSSFPACVMKKNLFDVMRQWNDGTPESQEQFRVELEEDLSTPADSAAMSIGTFTIRYSFLLVEFARRCFDVAGQLALQSAQEAGASDEGSDDHKEFMTQAAESHEECGLLLYNVLQEYSLLKACGSVDKFPLMAFSRVIDKAQSYFSNALSIAAASDKQHELSFRLHFMLGKTLKKKRWCENATLRREGHKPAVGLERTKEILTHFSLAEDARRNGELEDALVQAFYALQAMRMELLLVTPVQDDSLALVAEHYYKEEGDADEEDEETGEDAAESQSGHEISASEPMDVDEKNEQSPTEKATASKKRYGQEELRELMTRTDDRASAMTRALLFFNVVEALESIPDEDRYFHPSRYVLSWGLYHLRSIFPTWLQRACETSTSDFSLRQLHDKKNNIGNDGPLEHALKALAPLFDKKRPQVVAIWLSEYIPNSKKFEELNQRQQKYDAYRLKYWRLYIRLLQETEAYGKLKEVGAWVLACKEEHDVIDEMLSIVLCARGFVLRVRMQRFLGSQAPPEPAIEESMDSNESKAVTVIEEEPPLFKQLAKVYTYYVDVLDSYQRLEKIDQSGKKLLEDAERLLVAMFLVGVLDHPTHFPQLSSHEIGGSLVAAVAAIRENFMAFDENNEFAAWRMTLDATRQFCEERWPERMGRGKLAKSRLRLKPTSSTDASS